MTRPALRHSAADDDPIRIVIADDNAVVRDGVRAYVMGQSGFSVVGEAADGEQAWTRACELHPDVLLLDLSMPGVSGLEAVERIAADCPMVRIIVLTMHEERSYVARLTQAGAAGYVIKRTAAAVLAEAIRAVAVGGSYVDPAVSNELEGDDASVSPTSTHASDTEDLTGPEATILRLIARGSSNREIAAMLGLTGATVERERGSGMAKLGLCSRAALARYATERGWRSLES